VSPAVAAGAHGVGQLGEDARRLLLLVALEGDQVVVRLDHGLGLDEEVWPLASGRG